MLLQPLKRTDEEISSIARLVVENHEDEEIRNQFLTLAVQLLVPQTVASYMLIMLQGR